MSDIFFVKRAAEYCKKYNISPNIIFDIGCHELEESIQFSKIYPESIIYSFECNPEKTNMCIEKSKQYDNIKFYNYLISDINGPYDFYQYDADRDPGYSSIFEFDLTQPNFKGFEELYKQKKIICNSIRLDDFINNNSLKFPDILFMDIQGAEYLAFKGLGIYLNNIPIIATELMLEKTYKNCFVYNDSWKLLKDNFKLIVGDFSSGSLFDNFVFINKKYIL